MKWLFFILGLGLAFILGYRFEPSMRLQLTGVSPDGKPEAPELADAGEASSETPSPTPPPTVEPEVPAVDLAALTKEQLPERVLLKAEAEVGDAESNLRMKIPAGSRVSLVRIENGAVVVSPGAGPFEGTVPGAATDLLEQLAANPPPAAPPVVAQPDPAPAPDPVAVVEPAPTPEPAPPPVVATTDEEMEAPSPTPPATTVDVVSVMQQSIRSGEIKEFTFEQVLGWKPEAEESVDGETYQTGVAAYKADTIFGVKTIQAKALIKDGKVVRWIWPKSGMEIK